MSLRIKPTNSSLDHRSPALLNLVYSLGWEPLTFGVIYHVSYQGTENLDFLKDHSQEEGCIFLPKHQSGLDIPLVGAGIMSYLKTCPFYLMNDTLPDLLKKLGGIPITRGKDLQRREEVKIATERREEVYREVIKLLKAGENLVIFPEGTRRRKSTNIGKGPSKANLLNILRIQEEAQKQTGNPELRFYLVPVDIVYNSRSVSINFKPKIKVPNDGLDELVQHLAREVKLFTC